MRISKALLVGCGNIGAGYDFDSDAIITHAKAYHHFEIPFDCFDPNPELAERAAKKYGGKPFSELSQVAWDSYQCVSICSPTEVHRQALEPTLKAGVPLVFCEKPVASGLTDLAALETIRSVSNSFVVVNYMREFQPGFLRLKGDLKRALEGSHLESVVIRYTRGLLNNGSHALNLLEFLFDVRLELGGGKWIYRPGGHSLTDPTVSGIFHLASTPVHLVGLTSPQYSIFELEFNLSRSRIHVLESGNLIQFFTPSEQDGTKLIFNSKLSQTDCLKNYMIPVFEAGFRQLDRPAERRPFFERAVELNRKILKTQAEILETKV